MHKQDKLLFQQMHTCSVHPINETDTENTQKLS